MQFFEVQPDDFRLAVRCYLDNGKTRQQIESHWLEQLSLPKSCLRTTIIVSTHLVLREIDIHTAWLALWCIQPK